MREVIIIERQCLLDVALQEYGTATAVLDLALSNDMEVTDKLTPGQKLILPGLENERETLQYYKKRNVQPVTGNPLLIDRDLKEWFGGLPGMLPLMLS